MSLACMKKTVGFFAFIVLFLGIAVIVFTSLLLSSNNTALWNYSGVNYTESVTIAGLVVGILITLLGMQGIYGGCKRSRCCLSFYQFGIMMMAIAFLAVGVASSIYFSKFSDNIADQVDYNDKFCSLNVDSMNTCNSNCGNNYKELKEWLPILNAQVNTVANYFGTTNCQMQSINDQENQAIQNYKFKQYPYQFNQTGNLNVINCPKNDPVIQESVKYAINQSSGLMIFLESTFKCSGMCQPYNYYMYTNIKNSNNNLLTKPCFNAVQEFLNNYSLTIQLVTYITGSILFINVIFVFILCCKKEKKEGNIYTRMDYLD